MIGAMVESGPVHRWGIGAKALALAVGYVLLLCVVYGAFTMSLVGRETGRAEERHAQSARLLAAEVDAFIEAGRARLTMVAELPGMRYGLRGFGEQGNERRFPPWTTLHYLFYRSPVFTGGLFLLDRNGMVLWTEPPGLPWTGRDLAGHQTIAGLYSAASDTVSGRLEAEPLVDHPHVVVAVPVRRSDGEIEGVLGGVIDLREPQLNKLLAAVPADDGHFAAVIDQEGNVVLGQEPPVLQQAGAANARWMVAAVPLTQAPWKVLVGQPRARALADVWRVQRLLFTLGIGLLALALAIGTPLVSGFVRTIQSLTGAAEIMARGDLSRSVRIPARRDELATLATTLEQMRVELARSRAALERRIEEREELIRLKEAFLGNISHELRTPLNAILGYADMLADESLSTDGRERLGALRARSEQLHRLLSDLLTLSALNTGALAVEVSPVRLPVLVGRLQPLAESLRGGKNIAVVWDCPPSLPTIETDPLRLEQILATLIANAFKFTSEGRVALRARDQGDGHVTLEVSDTGVGIPAHEVPHIFDEFRQAESSLTRPHDGVGLGLTLVQKLTALLRGEVAVRSRVGAGTTFTVILPIQFDELRTSSDAAA